MGSSSRETVHRDDPMVTSRPSANQRTSACFGSDDRELMGPGYSGCSQVRKAATVTGCDGTEGEARPIPANSFVDGPMAARLGSASPTGDLES